MQTKISKVQLKTISFVERIIFIGLCIVLFFSPFFRGLYFEKELLPAHMLLFALALIWLIIKFKDKEYKLINTTLDILAVGIVFMYFISIFYGVNTRLAISEFLRYSNYLFIFLLVKDLGYIKNRKKILLNILVISAVIVAIIGIGSAIGTWNYNGAFVNGRINSTLQYPNALASYLGALLLITLGLLVIEDRKIVKGIYGVFSNILIFTFILTYSRGMWLILPFILIFFVTIIPVKRKIETIVYLFITILFATIFAFLFSQNLEGKNYLLWFIFILPSLLTGILIYVVSQFDKNLREISVRKFIVHLIIILAVLVSFIVYIANIVVPLTLTNNTTEDSWTRIIRNVEGVQPEKEYELVIKYESANKYKKPYSGQIRVYSVDSVGNLEKIEYFNIYDDLKNELKVQFKTLEKTEFLKIYFVNYYSKTSITFKEVILMNSQTKEIIKKIPLKYKYIPESIISRLESINLKNNSAQGRLTFYQDAFKIIKDNFLFGTGGGGWVTLYQAYQSYMYWTTQAHNYFLQMWIEIGFIGLVLFIIFIFYLSYFTYKAYKNLKEDNNRILAVSVYVSVISILIHAFMDFDLSLSAMSFMLWALIGILAQNITYTVSFSTFKEKSKLRINSNNRIVKCIFIVVLGLLIITSSSIFIGYNYSQKALAANKEKKLDETIKYFEKAAKFDPYKPEYKSDLSTFYRVKFKLTKDKTYMIKAKNLMDEVLKLARYNSRFNAIGASFYMSIGQVDRALELIDKSVELQPMRVENYIQKCDAYITAFSYYINQKKDLNRAKEVIERAYEIKKQIKEVNESALRPLEYNEDLLYKLGFIQFNYENLKNKEYMITNDYIIDFAYYFDLDINNDGILDKLETKNVNEIEVKYETTKYENNFIRIINNKQSLESVDIKGIKLEPNTEYKIYFKVRGNVNKDTLNVYIFEDKDGNKMLGGLTNINVNENWKLYSFNIQTDSNIKSGTQYISFQISGDNVGYIDIQEVIIFKKLSREKLY
ncbi:O-antigen ligase family protein [Caloranaerobacter ferrireducens]|uniref:O-antigen ligase family protein n=1 Tax=Caloranaerobacter ferrireducens TaxID=1323370 RepID=UPI00084D1C79|nr:O-antigen ligase family protein [Caloranaerobacter ferrireducens]